MDPDRLHGLDGFYGFYEIAAALPDRPAVVLPEHGTMSYGALHERANRIAHGLLEAGAEPGDAIAVVLPNGTDFLAVQLATFQIGLYFVPINWHFTAAEIAHILSDCSARLVVTAGPYAPAVREGAEEARVRCLPDGPAPLEDARPGTPPPARRMGSQMFYTSGTTGRPKGVRRRVLDITPETLHGILVRKTYRHFGLTAGNDVHLVTAPMCHTAPGAHALMSLNLGHSVVVPPGFSPEGMLELVERYRVTNTYMVPTMMHRLLSLPEDTRSARDLSSLRQIFHTAAPCPPAVKRGIMEWLGPIVYEYYGSTEAAMGTFVTPEEWLLRRGTVGRAIDGLDVKILSADGEEQPPGVPGGVYFQGISRFEYHRDPDKTAASMKGALYAPGDIGYLDQDGYLFLLDRRTDLIISGGVNIYPAEVEAVLMEHPSVADAVVIGVPDEEWGQRVVALVQPRASATPGDELTAELLAHCESRLARMKHPRRIEYRADLPRTPTGKLSRSAVRDAYLARERA